MPIPRNESVQPTAEQKPSAAARFWFNALVGVAFIVSATGFGLLGAIGVISIIGAGPGFALLGCSALLYLCGGRLIYGALVDGW
jgi:hypothetical protein